MNAKIQIEIVKSSYGNEHSDLRTFEDRHSAAKWLIEDSYFGNPNVIKVVWEVVEGCDHQWRAQEPGNGHMQFTCVYCRLDFFLSQEDLTKAGGL